MEMATAAAAGAGRRGALEQGYAERMTSADIERLEESCRRFVTLGQRTEQNLRAIVEENLFFHNVILANGPWSAGAPRIRYRAPEQFTTTFPLPGTYQLFCSLHIDMKGTFIVTP